MNLRHNIITALTAVGISLATSSSASAINFSEWVKGCAVFAGASVTGSALGISTSGAQISSPSALAASGVIGCLLGGYMAGDVQKKSSAQVDQELMLRNKRLKNQIYGVMHDLCVIKAECGADGVTPIGEYKKALDRASAKEGASQLIRPKTGN